MLHGTLCSSAIERLYLKSRFTQRINDRAAKPKAKGDPSISTHLSHKPTNDRFLYRCICEILERKMTSSLWDNIYAGSFANTFSWYQSDASHSLSLIHRVATDLRSPIIEVGGGASVLVDALLLDGYTDLSVLDVSSVALQVSRDRLGHNGERVRWIVANVFDAPLAEARYAVWHDRAAFHFLTLPEERRSYIAQMQRALLPGAHVIMATFAADGPTRCSGLDVVRYSPEALHRELGAGFDLIAHEGEEHHTPAGAVQAFMYCVFRRHGE
jgi:SAM-dependent methyltransferase